MGWLNDYFAVEYSTRGVPSSTHDKFLRYINKILRATIVIDVSGHLFSGRILPADAADAPHRSRKARMNIRQDRAIRLAFM